MTQEQLVALSDSPPDDSTLDNLVDIWDGKSMRGLTNLINDEIRLRTRSACTMRFGKRKAKVHDIKIEGS